MMESKPGKAAWTDLTIGGTENVRDFYKAVIGWTHQDLSMGEYSDYVMSTGEGEPAAGICHPRGGNAKLPPVWLVYFGVEDLAASLEQCRTRGGKVLAGPKGQGKGSYAVIEDPSGAVCALSQV
ncbi:VOC family protein [Paenibacillus sp. S-38]|uniref:VOC family protein n=1 Tax=Paenibacillus sp. S-38 TaxID=3416710 RepID=UPI003CF9268B